MSRAPSVSDDHPPCAPARGESRGAVAAGCLFSLASAALTCGLLFINGSLVLAILQVVGAAGFDPLASDQHEGLVQFALFVLPVALVVIQWMMIDYVRTRFRSRSSHPPE